MVRRHGRTALGLITGLIWGLGVAVLIQQLGLLPLNPYLLYGAPVGAALVSVLWSRRRMAALIVLIPGLVVAQAEPCPVTVNGDSLNESTLFDPVRIPEGFNKIDVTIDVPKAGQGALWVEFGGFQVPVRSGPIQLGAFPIEKDELEPFVAPGLYQIGGTIDGVCTGSGYIRIEGNPLDSPVGQAAAGAVVIGLLGTWLAGRRPGRQPHEPGPERESELEPGPRPSSVMIRPPRLRARLYDAATRRTLDRFVAGRSHFVDVDLASPDPTWERIVGAATPTDLTVVLTEPALAPSPQVGRLATRSGMTNAPISFRLEVPLGTSEVDVRLIAMADNRILHTVRLPLEVDTDLGPRVEAPPSTNVAIAETTVSIGLRDHGPGPIDVALLVNHRGDTPHVTGIAGEEAAVVEVGDGDIAEAVEKIRGRLGEIVEQPADFGALDAPGSIELLVFLAHHGRLIRNALVGDFLRGRLADASNLQIVSATPDAYFPFEFAYDFPAPEEDAMLCPQAIATLNNAEPMARCPAEHSPGTVCPLGFWALTRVMERHAYQAGDELPAGFLVRSLPREGRSHLSVGSILFAASDRVDGIASGTIRRLSTSLAEATDGHTVEVRAWDEWISDVARGPALTILLPHTVYSDTLDIYGLEIGASDRSWAGEIDERFVPPVERPVITVLLGCETAVAGRVSYEKFPGLFRRAGAEVVVATLTEILGRHGAPVADALAREIVAGWHRPSVRFGEVMLALRRRLIAQGVIAVLAVVTYGDADWDLGGGPISGSGVASTESPAG
jgi:hypothetical protein